MKQGNYKYRDLRSILSEYGAHDKYRLKHSHFRNKENI